MTTHTNTLDEARSLIEKRLAAIDGERRSLERAVKALSPSPSKRSAPARNRGSAGRKRRSKQRAPRGQRQQQFLDHLKRSPGRPLTQVAKTMGVNPTQLYPLAKRLSQQGLVERSQDGYQLTASTTTSSPTRS